MTKQKTIEQIRKEVIEHILKVEGGYVNDPKDSGGETNYGITKKVARMQGYHGNMRDLPRETAIQIYEKLYWHNLKLDDVFAIAGAGTAAEKLVREIGDTGVNMGTGSSARFLQQCLNVLTPNKVAMDGIIGNQSLNALKAHTAKRGEEGIIILTAMVNCLQGARYIQLALSRPKDKRFIWGWIKNRVLK